MENKKVRETIVFHSDHKSKEITKDETDYKIGKKESASTSSFTSSSPNKDKSKGIPVGIAAYAAAAAAAAARAKKTNDNKTNETEKVDKPKPKSGLSLVSYSRSPSISDEASDDDNDHSKMPSLPKSLSNIISPTKEKETKASTPILISSKVENPKISSVASASHVEKTLSDRKISVVSSTKTGPSSHVEKIVTEARLPGMSSTEVGATSNLIKLGLTGKNRIINISKPINRTNMPIPKEVSSSQQKISIIGAPTGVTANKIKDEYSQNTNIKTQSLDSAIGVDIKAKAPEKNPDTSHILQLGKAPEKKSDSSHILQIGKAPEKKTDTSHILQLGKAPEKKTDSSHILQLGKVPEKKTDSSQILQQGNSSTLHKKELSSNIKSAIDQVTKILVKQKINVESGTTPVKHLSQSNPTITESQKNVPNIISLSSANKSEKAVNPDNKQQIVSLSTVGNKLLGTLVEKSNVNVPVVKQSISKPQDVTKPKIFSPKPESSTTIAMKEKSLEEVSFNPVMSKKTPDLDHLEKNLQTIKSTISPHITKSFPKAGSSSAMSVDPSNIGKKEAQKRPCPEVLGENNQPSDKREKKETVNREKDMEVKGGNKTNSTLEENVGNNMGINLKEAKGVLSNEIKEQVLTNGSSGSSELVDDGSNDIEMKEESNDVDIEMKADINDEENDESLDDLETDKDQRKKGNNIIDETYSPTPSEEGSEDDKNEDDEGDEIKDDKDEDEDDKDEDEDDDNEDDDDDCNTPTRRSSRKKPKKFYERPRGYAGKFLPQKKQPEISALIDENARMDMDEDSQGSATSKKKERKYRCEVINPESTEAFTADKVVEYVWPLEGNGEHYFLQEQISQFLGIMSFKRRYPDLRRRPIEMQERDYLKEKGYVSEMACDLGLTAVRSEDVLDVMCSDFPRKFESLSTLMREKQEKELRDKGKVDYSLANIDKSKMQEYASKAAEQAARWNSNLNKERREERRYSFDLSSFTLHINKGRGKILPADYTKIGCYPVSVLPGQFTDSYRMYSSAALHTLPLGTVTSEPLNDELGSDGEQSASEEEAKPAPIFSEMPWIYSKQANNTPNKENVTENTGGGRRADFEINFKIQVAEYALGHTNAQAERKFQTSEANVRRWKQQLDNLKAKAAANGLTKASDKPEEGPKCKHCSGNRQENKSGRPEPMLTCASCKCHTHITCVDLTTVMIPKLESYKWQCIDCKTCMQCNDPDDAEKMIFCDMCDRGYHIYCVGLKRVPNGRWHCKVCAVCSSCGSLTPQGDEHIKNAEWQHEFKKDSAKQLRYAATLCIPCDRFWKRRQFCYICTKVYKSIPEDGMVRCANCPKYIHKNGCSTTFENEIFCNICYKSRNSSALNHSRIIAAAKKKMARSY